MEACASAHYWARELAALDHEVKLMPPRYVKAYVKRNKNDAADAEAICEAVTRPWSRAASLTSRGTRRCGDLGQQRTFNGQRWQSCLRAR